MIRFVEVSGIDPHKQQVRTHFGFWDTVVDRFIEFDGDQLLDSIAEWDEAVACETAAARGKDPGVLDRCRRLMPERWPRDYLWRMKP